MNEIPDLLREAIDELTRVGRDPNHTTEQLREAMKRVQEARESALASSREYAEHMKRSAESRRKKFRDEALTTGFDIPHGGSMSYQRPRTARRR